MSTADSQLLVTASAVSEDLYHQFAKRDADSKTIMKVGRITVIVVSLLAFVIAWDPESSIMGLVSMPGQVSALPLAHCPDVSVLEAHQSGRRGCRNCDRWSDRTDMGLHTSCGRKDPWRGNGLYSLCGWICVESSDDRSVQSFDQSLQEITDEFDKVSAMK